MIKLLFLFFTLIFSLFPKEDTKDSKIIYLKSFKPYKTDKQSEIEKNIYNKIKEDLESKEYIVIDGGQGDVGKMSKHDNAHLVVDGYYKKEKSGSISIYSQIYHPEKGNVIDAINVKNEIPELEGVELPKDELYIEPKKTIDDFSKKLTIRIRSNSSRKEKRENINEHIISDQIGRDKNFPISKENAAAASEDVFKILAEKSEQVTVASNVVTSAEKQPASVSVISRQQIRMSGARTLNELLTIYVPGFFTVEDQDDTIAGFRGFAPDNNAKVLTLINGHNMNTEWFWGPPDSIINGLNMDYIERIEVIRGPGSVTLGQGALLGVVNIITRDANSDRGVSLSGMGGKDSYALATLQGGFAGKELKDLKTYFQMSTAKYRGQEIRNRGWAKAQEYESVEGHYDFQKGLTEVVADADVGNTDLVIWPVEGGNSLVTKRNVATSGSRLKRSRHDVVLGRLEYKNFDFTGFYTNQSRNLYNFYRDRNVLQNTVKSANLSYLYDISSKLSLKFKTFYTEDDLFLRSNGGFTMGGTRENRYGGSIILNVKEMFKNNNLAIGIEYRKYDMGNKNSENNNFIVNNADSTLLDSVNTTHRYVYPDTIPVYSAFAEDFYSLSDKVDIFAAFRYDKHPHWGNNVSPRLGTLYAYNNRLRFRLSYQEGFRGVVGVSYAGGFQKDGHLRIQNFQNIEISRIPTTDANGNATYYQNIPETNPEKMKSFEFATNYKFANSWSIEGILFYNKLKNIIDVGVLYADPTQFTMPNLGTDEPGDWNGYWFYKNAAGEIRQGGIEFSIQYKSKRFHSTFSHSLVRLITASPTQFDSVYLTSDINNQRFKGYPENVTRWNNLVYITEKWLFSLNYLFYPSWYSPRGNRIVGNHLINSGITYNILKNMELYLMVKNVLNHKNLYPMISNSGGETLSDGTPAVELRTYWLGFNYTF
ncbi:MAG: TonB-dependent receptor [Leptospiraceae bacterium]|nr:TonB-dependent receptor [Leptospiraceae bacterium]MCP5494675.1 TonB-dependent receptor [Leptospiraceae bacterium]